MKNLLLVLLLFFLFIPGYSQAQEASVSLDKKEIKIGEQSHLKVEIRFSSASEVIFPALKDTISKFIQIVDIGTIDTAFDEDDIKIKIFSQNITITSFDSGYHVIRPMKFIVDGDSVFSEALMLTVNSVPVPPNADLSDIKPVLDVPFSFWEWIVANKWYILSVIGLLVLIAVGIYLYKKYKDRPVPKFEKPKPLEPAHIIAQRKLKELKEKKLWQNDQVKIFHVELSHIIREYLENRFGTNSLDETTDEILSDSQSLDISSENRQKLAQVLTLADMAKFAKQQPVSFENEESLKNTEAFIDSTKEIEVEEASTSTKIPENQL